MECFQKNPALRISAKRLLKHPWIVSAKRTVPPVPTKPTEYREAVKSVQEWNEALNSQTLRRSSRLASGARRDIPHTSSSTAGAPAVVRKSPVNVNLNIPKHRPNADLFRSPEVDKDDNWDNDFAESISPRAFHQPHLKPQDNFGGLFSGDRLKAFASFDALTEEAPNSDGEATVKSPLNLQDLRGISAAFGGTGSGKSSTKARASASRSTSASMPSEEHHEGQPKTAFLRGVPRASELPKSKVAALARPSQMFRENSVEDYSDLMPADESAFEKKLRAMQGAHPSMLPQQKSVKAASSSPAESFSPKLFHPSDLKTAPKSTRETKVNGNVRQRSASSTSTRKMQRSQSEIEIQKYAEDDRDDFSDVFGDIRTNKAESDSGSEHSMAMITSKMSSSFVSSRIACARLY